MAERLDDQLAHRLGRPTLYPWEQWADGAAWRIVRGDDFKVSVESMRSALWSHAQRNSLRVATRVDGDAITFQFIAAPESDAA